MQNCMLSCFVAWIVLVYSTTLAKNQQRFIIFHVQFGGSKWVRFLGKKSTYIQWPSSSEIFHILLGKLAYFIIRFLLNSSIVKSDNGIGLFWNWKKSDYTRTRSRCIQEKFSCLQPMKKYFAPLLTNRIRC